MNIGYARVSTVGQDYENQKALLENEKCEKIFVEKITATSTKQRTELKAAMEYVREGDTLIVTKIDRLARSISDLNRIIEALRVKGVNVKFLSENLYFDATNDNNSIKTLLFNILGSFAQFERDLIVERTTEGRARAIKQGKKMGRPGQDEKDIKRALRLYYEREENNMSVADITKLTGVPRSTIYLKARQNEGKNEKQIAQ